MRNFEIKNNDCHAALAMTKSVQSGRSMIEMLGVLAIIGVLSVGGIAGYSKAMMKYRINKTIEQVTLIAGNVRTFFASQGNYDGARCGSDTTYNLENYNSCAVAKKAKLFPDEMLTITNGSITNIENPFGGRVGINEYSYPHKNFTIALNKLPLEACIELASHDWSTANAVNITIVPYDGNHFYYYDDPKPISTPADINDVITKCSDISSNMNIGLFIYFK